jgi:hypothetical protein
MGDWLLPAQVQPQDPSEAGQSRPATEWSQWQLLAAAAATVALETACINAWLRLSATSSYAAASWCWFAGSCAGGAPRWARANCVR